MRITHKTLGTNEYVGLSVLKVESIPHISIISSDESEIEIIENYKKETKSLLDEIFQLYKSKSIAFGSFKDVSLEILWKSNPVNNQQFKANIDIFIIIRAIDKIKDTVNNLIESIAELCKSSLSSQKYDVSEMEEKELYNLIKSINDNKVTALVKEEKFENLQNQILPYCYSFDRFPHSNNDLSRIVNVLTEYPNCAVSMQLIPSQYYESEANEVDRIAQSLETLSNGIMDRGMGNISFAIASKHAENYRYYSDNKHKSLFIYNIIIYGNENSATNITSKVFGQLSTGTEESANIKSISLNPQQINKDNNFYPLPWAVNELLLNKDRNQGVWSSGNFSNSLYRLPFIITSEEACEFFRLPIGTRRVSAGLNINESGKNNKTYSDNIINSGDISVGVLKSSSNSDTIGFSLNDLAKHMLVVGTPGSGKTTFSVSLLDRLWKEHNIPFLVIEPAKNEYRALIQSIPDIQIFTPGKNFVSPFVYNPFVPPKNVKLESYKSTLKTAFAAGVSMTTPLDKIFEESINNCYSDFRWLDTYTIDDKGKVFNISDFIKCFQQTFDEIGYTGDAKNIGRAGVVRLNSLTNLFDNYYSIPIEDILNKPTIIELSAIENSDQKALIIALILLSILSYVNANYIGEGGLKNVILLEEAHVLLDADTNTGQGEANPSAIAQGLVKRMLAEIRSYGVGLIVADQSPRKVGTDVVALTDMKVVFRLVEAADKQIIGDSTNMSDTQIQRMAKLKPGEAYLFYNKLDEPEEVVTPDYRLENNISISLSDADIQQLSTYWNSKQEKLKPYPQCLCIKHCEKNCDYNCRILSKEIARRIYNRYFNPQSKDPDVLKKVYKNLPLLIKTELNDEPYSEKLLACVKVHFFRKIKYSTKIKIRDDVINSVLNNSK